MKLPDHETFKDGFELAVLISIFMTSVLAITPG